jgi:hypothetical protein
MLAYADPAVANRLKYAVEVHGVSLCCTDCSCYQMAKAKFTGKPVSWAIRWNASLGGLFFVRYQ